MKFKWMHIDLKLHQVWMMLHQNLIGKLCIQLCIQPVGSSCVPHIRASLYKHMHTQNARTLTLLRKISNSTKTSDFYSRLIFSNGIWQRWCQFVFFQICNLNASRMNNDIMYIIIYVLNVVGRSRYAIHQGYKYWPKERKKMQTTTPTATAAYIHKKQSSQPRSA